MIYAITIERKVLPPVKVKVEEVQNEVLNELHYIVTWPGFDPFIMAYCPDELQLIIQGNAPYEAKEYEDELGMKIEQLNY